MIGNEAPTIQSGKGEASDPHVTRLMEWVEKAEKYWRKYFKRSKETRQAARFDVSGESLTTDQRIQLGYSLVQGLLPHLYARNPEIAIGPAEGVDRSQLPAIKAFSGVLQTILNMSFRQAGIKQIAKACTRGSLTSALNWSKTLYSRDFRRDPIIQQRLEDAQDNIARLDRMIRDMQEPGGDVESQKAELLALVASLQKQVEVVVSEGLVVDRIFPEHLILDPSITTLDDWSKSRRITQIIYRPRETAEELCGRELDGATTYAWEGDCDDDARRATHANEATDPMIKLYEIWDKDTLTVYTGVEGLNEWAREPYQPEKLGEQWYPFHPLALFPADGNVWPLSLIDLVERLIDEYNDARDQRMRHRQLSIPHWIADEGTDPGTIKSYTHAQIGEVVIVDANGRPMSDVFAAADPPSFNPLIYDLSDIRYDLDTLSGLQDAARGGIVKAKTLGEAEIMQQGLASRTDEMRSTIEDWFEAMAKYSAEVLLQELTPMQASRMAGMQALVSWPIANKREIFEQTAISIRAGTSGKPDAQAEQRTWGVLLPIIERLQGAILMEMSAGVDPSPKIALLQETIRRFDETLEIEEFVPVPARMFLQGGSMPAMPPMMPPGAPPVQGAPSPAQPGTPPGASPQPTPAM